MRLGFLRAAGAADTTPQQRRQVARLVRGQSGDHLAVSLAAAGAELEPDPPFGACLGERVHAERR